MQRIRHAVITGTLDVAISDSATTIESTALADLPVVEDGDVAVLILDARKTNGPVECIYVTAHTAAATTATVTRGEEQSVGHGAARAHGTGTTWSLSPTPLDYGFQPEAAPIAANPREATLVPHENGRIPRRLVVVGPDDGGGHENTFIGLPPADLVPGEHVIVVCADSPTSMQFGIGPVDDRPTAGTLDVGTLFGLIVGHGILDLTTATLGHPFVSEVVVDGVLLTSAPIDAVFDTDDFGEVSTLMGALVGDAVGAGVVIGMDGIATSPTTGLASEVRFDAGQESFLGIDFVADVPTVAGALGSIDGVDGTGTCAGAAAHYDPDEWRIPTTVSPVVAGNLANYHRSCVLWAIPADQNGGTAKWAAERFPYRQVDIPIISNVTGIENLKNLTTVLVTVGALGDGDYVLGLTMAGGTGVLSWVPA